MKTKLYLSAVGLMASTVPAMAYIDPITGSFILQGLIGGFAAASLAFKRVREKLLGLFGLGKDDSEAESISGADSAKE